MENGIVRKSNLQVLAGQVISRSLSGERRAECIWLEERFEEFLKKSGLSSRNRGDELICRRMAEALGRKADQIADRDILRIRFWRTGRHYPRNRILCRTFGDAMALDEEEQRMLMTAWFDRADRCFSREDTEDPVYRSRVDLLRQLQKEFLLKQLPEELLVQCAPGTEPEDNLRHIYCMQARRYLGSTVRQEMTEVVSHVDTRAYDPQFNREMKLLGEVSRSAVIRHLLILGMPFVNRSRMNQWLTALGYLPLDEKHRQIQGYASDLLILGLLEEYENECTGRPPEECFRWFRTAAGMMDDALEAAGCGAVNPFRFKHLLGGTHE